MSEPLWSDATRNPTNWYGREHEPATVAPWLAMLAFAAVTMVTIWNFTSRPDGPTVLGAYVPPSDTATPIQ